MKRTSRLGALSYSASLALCLLGAGQPRGEDAQNSDKTGNRPVLADWTGIAFYCDLQPKEKSNQELCDWAKQRTRLAAASVGVPFISVSDGAYDRYVDLVKAKRIDDLQVQFKVFSTTNISPIGIYVQLSAISRYIAAAEVNSFGSRPEKLPRSADVVFWEREIIGASTYRTAELDSSLRNNIETMILKLVSEFAESRGKASR